MSDEEYSVWLEQTYDQWRQHILTSAINLTTTGVEEAIVNYMATGSPGKPVLELENRGVGYATSGGHIDPFVPEIDAAIQALINGEVVIEVDYTKPVVLVEDVVEIAPES